MVNSIAAGGGVVLAGFLKKYMGLKGVFAGVSLTILVAALILVYGYVRYIKRDLARVGLLESVGIPAGIRQE